MDELAISAGEQADNLAKFVLDQIEDAELDRIDVERIRKREPRRVRSRPRSDARRHCWTGR